MEFSPLTLFDHYAEDYCEEQYYEEFLRRSQLCRGPGLRFDIDR